MELGKLVKGTTTATYTMNYIDSDYLKTRLFINVDDPEIVNDVSNAIQYASRRINYLSGNKIDIAGGLTGGKFDTYQQECIKAATAEYARYLLQAGLQFLRGSVSGSIGTQASYSQAFPNEPDYLQPAIRQQLENAGLYYPLQTQNLKIDGDTCEPNDLLRILTILRRYVPFLQNIKSTASIKVTDLTAALVEAGFELDLIKSPDAGNSLEIRANGVYVGAIASATPSSPDNFALITKDAQGNVLIQQGQKITNAFQTIQTSLNNIDDDIVRMEQDISDKLSSNGTTILKGTDAIGDYVGLNEAGTDRSILFYRTGDVIVKNSSGSIRIKATGDVEIGNGRSFNATNIDATNIIGNYLSATMVKDAAYLGTDATGKIIPKSAPSGGGGVQSVSIVPSDKYLVVAGTATNPQIGGSTYLARMDTSISQNTAGTAANKTAIGTLASLTTTAKTNIVAAINEVNSKPSGTTLPSKVSITQDTTTGYNKVNYGSTDSQGGVNINNITGDIIINPDTSKGGSVKLNGDVYLGSAGNAKLISNVHDPIAATDAATKSYVDSHTSAPTKAQVYALNKTINVAGPNFTIANDDIAMTQTFSSTSTPVGPVSTELMDITVAGTGNSRTGTFANAATKPANYPDITTQTMKQYFQALIPLVFPGATVPAWPTETSTNKGTWLDAAFFTGQKAAGRILYLSEEAKQITMIQASDTWMWFTLANGWSFDVKIDKSGLYLENGAETIPAGYISKLFQKIGSSTPSGSGKDWVQIEDQSAWTWDSLGKTWKRPNLLPKGSYKMVLNLNQGDPVYHTLFVDVADSSTSFAASNSNVLGEFLNGWNIFQWTNINGSASSSLAYLNLPFASSSGTTSHNNIVAAKFVIYQWK